MTLFVAGFSVGCVVLCAAVVAVAEAEREMLGRALSA